MFVFETKSGSKVGIRLHMTFAVAHGDLGMQVNGLEIVTPECALHLRNTEHNVTSMHPTSLTRDTPDDDLSRVVNVLSSPKKIT